jgi:hypothetical protein
MMSEKKTIEINETCYIVVEFIDDDSYPWQAEECYGKYDNEPSKWAIDCKNGWLLGDEEEEPYRDDYESQEEFDTDMQSYRDKLEVWRVLDKQYSKDFEDWENRHGYKILRDVSRTCYDRNSYQFFHPEYAEYLLNCENATELTEEQMDTIEKQYRRMYELNQGWWGYIGIEVTLFVCGAEIASESLWGIESDEKEYHKEVVKDLLSAVTSDITLEIDDEISHLKLKIEELEEAKKEIPSEEEIKEKVLAEI